ncbi:unnamed protein product [Ectocarpus fasciculatus]
MSKAAAPARAVASRAAPAAPKRGMAGGAAPKYTGWEAQVREKLPKDEHVLWWPLTYEIEAVVHPTIADTSTPFAHPGGCSIVPVVVAISGFYVGLYVVCKGISALFSSPKKKEVAAPVVASSATSSDIPEGYEDNFWQWLEGAGNMEKYLATIDKAQ